MGYNWTGVYIRRDLKLWIKTRSVAKAQELIGTAINLFYGFDADEEYADGVSRGDLSGKLLYMNEPKTLEWIKGTKMGTMIERPFMTFRGMKFLTGHIVYTLEVGAMPKNGVRFIDNDVNNFSIENLEAITPENRDLAEYVFYNISIPPEYDGISVETIKENISFIIDNYIAFFLSDRGEPVIVPPKWVKAPDIADIYKRTPRAPVPQET